MRKRNIIKILLLLVICIIAAAGCSKNGRAAGSQIYYTDSERSMLVEKSYKLEGKTAEEQVKNILEKLQKKTDNIDYQTVFIRNVKIKKWSLKDKKLTIHFNEEYHELSATEELLLRAAVVQSVGAVDGVDCVRFMIGHEPLQDQQGEIIGYMRPDDFVQNTGSSLHSLQKETLLLYFGNKKGDRLVKEKVNVRYNSNTSREKALIEQLIKGPDSDNETAVIPAGTKVLGVSVKDNICYVNLDDGFMDTTNVLNAEIPVYAIVNSVIDGSSISRVQILVNGQTDIQYMGKVDLSKPLSRNPNIVEGE